MKNAALPLMALLAGLAMASRAHADFEIVLRDGGRMVVDSYQVRGEKLFAYRSSGVLEIDRSRVESVREQRGDDRLPPPSATTGGAVKTSRPAIAAERRNVATAPAPPSPVGLEDVTVRERELTRQIISANREVLFAQNRGEAQSAIEKRKNEIGKLESEQSALHKQSAGH